MSATDFKLMANGTFMSIEEIMSQNGQICLLPQNECSHEKIILWYDEKGQSSDMVGAAYGRCSGCFMEVPSSPVIIPEPPPKIWRPPAKCTIWNLKKQAARQRFHRAKRRGEIARKPCEVCGDPNSEAHHPDYLRPLYVIWLCRPHHVRADAYRRMGEKIKRLEGLLELMA